MSRIFSTPALLQRMAVQSWVSGLFAVTKRCWVAYIIWRIDQAAIAPLSSMSDREPKDTWLIRSEIVARVARTLPWRPS
jgi:hypothetical protein